MIHGIVDHQLETRTEQLFEAQQFFENLKSFILALIQMEQDALGGK